MDKVTRQLTDHAVKNQYIDIDNNNIQISINKTYDWAKK